MVEVRAAGTALEIVAAAVLEQRLDDCSSTISAPWAVAADRTAVATNASRRNRMLISRA